MGNSVILKRGTRHWILKSSALYGQKEFSIDWNSFIPPETCGDPQRRSLTKSAREILWEIANKPCAHGGEMCHSTILQWYSKVRQLVRWMISNEIYSFGNLAPGDVELYLRSLVPRKGGPPILSQATHYQHVNLFSYLWQFRARLSDPVTFNVHAFQDELKSKINLRDSIPWKALPEADAVLIIRTALELISQHGKYVISLVDRVWSEHEATLNENYYTKKRRRREFYATVAQEKDFISLSTRFGTQQSKPYIAFRNILVAFEGAIIASFLFLVGFRAKELASLEIDCVIDDEAGNGTYLLKGIAAKKGGKPRTWAITQTVLEVVEVAKLLFNAPRSQSGSRSLMLENIASICYSSKIRDSLPKSGDGGGIDVRLKRFANVALPHGAKISGGIHPHVARKTFARFVVMRDKSTLEALAYHFGHTHRAITDGYYVGADIELARLLDAENRADLEASITTLLTSSNIAGKAGEEFASWRRERQNFRGKATLKSVVDMLIRDGIVLAPCNWGFCVYSRAHSACHGDQNGPNEVNRTADVCSSCSNFAVTEKHRPWWEARVRQDEEFLRTQHQLPEQTVNFIERRLKRSNEIIFSLNGSKSTSRQK